MTSAAAALSGTPSPAPAAAPASSTPAPAGGDGGAAAVAAAAAAATASAPASGGQTSGTPAPAANDKWFSGIADENVRTWVEAKGFTDANAAVASAYNLEKLLGFDRAGRTLVVPDEKSTPEQVAAFRTKIGVPEKPDGYGIKAPEGQDGTFANFISEAMHKAGIPAKAAQDLVKAYGEFGEQQQKAANEAFERTSATEFEGMKTEWGKAYDQNIELAKRAAAQFIPGDQAARGKVMDAMERAMGTANFLRMFAKIGEGLAEHKMHGGGDSSLIMTPAQAQQRINELKSNKEWTASYLAGDKAKLKEMQDLVALANPVQEG